VYILLYILFNIKNKIIYWGGKDPPVKPRKGGGDYKPQKGGDVGGHSPLHKSFRGAEPPAYYKKYGI